MLMCIEWFITLFCFVLVISARLGLQEDLEDIKREEEELKRKMEKKKKK